ncbi:MAG TPA: SprT family zinc-dependent metalloprotease [Xanthobacteraceae bacterium]
MLRPLVIMAVFRPGLLQGGLASMSLRALLYRRPSEPSVVQVVFDKAIYLVRVRRHRQARRYTLRIDAAAREVVLTMPPRGSLREAKEFAQKHGGWIAARLNRLPAAAPFAHGVEVPLRGEPHRIVHRRGARGTVWVETDLGGSRLLCVAGEPPHVDRRVSDFLKREAQRDLEAAARRYALKLGVSFKRICVRDQSSRWGSCSNTGVLSFSWRLIFAPGFVLDYLAAHEVSHLVELNHSLRFWRLVKRVYSDVERAKAWLDANGTDLHRYGLSGRRRAGDI